VEKNNAKPETPCFCWVFGFSVIIPYGHSHATFMLRLGVNVKAMQRRMGHSTFATTMDCYAHVLEDLGREAADTLNDGLQGIMPIAKVR